MIKAKIRAMVLSDGISLVSTAVLPHLIYWGASLIAIGQKAAHHSELVKDDAIHSVSSQCTRSHYIAKLTHFPLPSLACAHRALVFALPACLTPRHASHPRIPVPFPTLWHQRCTCSCFNTLSRPFRLRHISSRP